MKFTITVQQTHIDESFMKAVDKIEGVTDTEREELRESRRMEIENFAKKWLTAGVGLITLDTEADTATIERTIPF